MTRLRSTRRGAALRRAGFSPEPSAPQVPPELVAKLGLEPTEPYVEVSGAASSSDSLEYISDVSVSPVTTPSASLYSSSAFSTPKILPAVLLPEEDLSEKVILPPTYTPAALTGRLNEYRSDNAVVSDTAWKWHLLACLFLIYMQIRCHLSRLSCLCLLRRDSLLMGNRRKLASCIMENIAFPMDLSTAR